MLVVFYNAVKVESVPLKFDEFSSSTQAQRARRILEDPGQPRGAHQCPEEPAVVRRQHAGDWVAPSRSNSVSPSYISPSALKWYRSTAVHCTKVPTPWMAGADSS